MLKRLATRFVLFSTLITTAMAERRPPSTDWNTAGFQVWRNVPSAGAMSSSTANKTTSVVPAIVVDNPSTVGKSRTQNACDRCSLCLGKVGYTTNSRDTLKSIYQEGVYEYESRERSLDKCLNNRFCKDCGTEAVTYTLPSTTFAEGEIKRILADKTFPPQSYLLDIQYDITLTNNHSDFAYVADLFTLLGNPGVTYTDVVSKPWLVVATPYLSNILEGPLGSLFSYGIGIVDEAAGFQCLSDITPANCKAKLTSSLCTRYTYAAEKENYPLTYIDMSIDGRDPNFVYGRVSGSLALPTSPTTCFPVTEFDLSKYPIYLGYGYLGLATYEGKVTLVYTKAATKK